VNNRTNIVPTAWQSIPEFIRLVVWIWAVASLVGLVVAVVIFAGMLLGS
jgi:hypothetical protein